jgi:thioredoxin-like negative regulator of GroEL
MIFFTHESDLHLNSKIISLYFYASWMPYHKKMVNMINKIEIKYKDITFYAIDTDHFKSLCKRFNVTSIPEVILLVNGEEVKRINGVVLTSTFKSVFGDIYNSCNPKNGEIL